jgi:hypothetical protein
MANILQSSQTQATNAPGYYSDYLSNIANQGREAAGQAKFVDAQPLQTEAFCRVASNFGAAQPAFKTGQNYVGQAAGQDVTGAASPFLRAGTSASPLCAARPFICGAANMNLSCVASQYMSPYIKTAVQGLSDIAHRNIRQNLSPAATAAAVGSGQYGSQRGAQVLGQVQAQAEQCLNQQIASMENAGYGQALQAAQAKLGALGSLANTASGAQQAQNQANLTAGQTAAQAAANEGNLLNTAGATVGNLGSASANTNLACINALSTLGGQQQTIAQNKQNFPLTNLSNLAGLLQGYSIPTSTTTTLCMSPLSGMAAVGTGIGGLLQPDQSGKNMLCAITGSDSFGKLFCRAYDYIGGLFGDEEDPLDSILRGYANGGDVNRFAEGGQVNSILNRATGGMSMSNECSGFVCGSGMICSPFAMARGGLAKAIRSGRVGCLSTRARGALPGKRR